MFKIFAQLFIFTIGVVITNTSCFAEEPWLLALPRDPVAREIIERRCKSDAKEKINLTVEGIATIFVAVEGDYAFQDIFINTNSSGLSYSNFWLGFSGNYVIEADGLRFFSSKENPENLPVASIARNGIDRSFRKDRQSFITVVYQRETTDEEQLSGVYGRKITIRDEKSKIILAQRTEFFWLSSPGFKNGVRQENAICPYTQPMAKSPTYFVNQVINPVGNPCSRLDVERHGALKDWAAKEFRDVAKHGMDRVGMEKYAAEYQRREKVNHEELQACWFQAKVLPLQ